MTRSFRPWIPPDGTLAGSLKRTRQCALATDDGLGDNAVLPSVRRLRLTDTCAPTATATATPAEDIAPPKLLVFESTKLESSVIDVSMDDVDASDACLRRGVRGPRESAAK